MVKRLVVAVVFAASAGVMGGLALHWFNPHVASAVVFIYGFVAGRACERLRWTDMRTAAILEESARLHATLVVDEERHAESVARLKRAAELVARDAYERGFWAGLRTSVSGSRG